MKNTLSLLALLFTLNIAYAQNVIKGTVSDVVSGETLIGANVLYGTNQGTVTDIDGNYELSLENGTYKLTFSYVGYESIERTVTVNGKDQVINVKLNQDILDEVTLVVDIAQERVTPVAFTSITPKKLQEELGGRDLPLVLNQTPGVFASQGGGGDGDARINIRGFKQENMAVLIDGIPVNDMENGYVYWSNWFGLDIITSRMQVQRGLSASKLSIPSVGGTINIITAENKSKEYLKVKQGLNQFGKSTTSLGYNSGLLKGNWNITGAFAYKNGDNYVEQTNIEGYFAYMKISKRLKNHTLAISSFIAPQERGQVKYKVPIATYDTEYARDLGVNVDGYGEEDKIALDQGRKYNLGWGRLSRTRYNNDVEEEIVNVRKNFYKKPQFNFNHSWLVNDKLNISNVLYASIGRGGGTRLDGGDKIQDLLDENGQVNLQYVYDKNSTLGGFKTTYKSETIIAADRNDHEWFGLLSKIDYDYNDSWNISGGLDLRTYKGTHYREVRDLLGGDYYEKGIEKLYVGDKYNHDNTTTVKWGGAFAQVEYTEGALASFLNISGSTIGFSREDRMPETKGAYKSGEKWKAGGTIKSGANYNIDEKSNVFVNLGYLSKQRPSNSIFDRYAAVFLEDVSNETVKAFEIGFHHANKKYTFDVNTYYTKWIGKATSPVEIVADEFLQVPSLDARHMGLEIDGVYKFSKKLDIQGTVSLGDWIWTKDLKDVAVLDDDNQFLREEDFKLDGIYVGDAPQQQLAVSSTYKPIKGGYIRLKYSFNAKYYSDFSPSDNIEEGAKSVQPWRIPNFSLVDLAVGYRFKIKNQDVSWSFNMYNLFDTKYISDARNNDGYISTPDGSLSNTASNASVYMGRGRNFSTSLSMTF